MTNVLSKLFHLQEGELKRLTPFFLLYGVLFGSLTIGDGLSLAMFVQRVGADDLPLYYGLTAIVSLVLIYAYLRATDRWSNRGLFLFIVLTTAAQFLTSYTALTLGYTGDFWYGSLFVAREVAYTMILMHFGTYLQDYFTRAELNRVLPLVYAGGRVGGIFGAALLTHLSPVIGLVNLVLAIAVIFLGCGYMIHWLEGRHAKIDETEPTSAVAADFVDSTGPVGLMKFVVSTPLMLWFSTTGLLYMMCRWVLNFQYSHYFEGHFASDVALAEFIGHYTQAALLFSLVFQVFCVSRLIHRIGLTGTHVLYNMIVMAAFVLNAGPMSLSVAVFSRFVETDLRFSLRNPVNQLMTNKFSKATRVKARAITLGAVNPIATLCSSFLLTTVVALPGVSVAGLGLLLGGIYIVASVPLYRSLGEAPLLRWSGFGRFMPRRGRS